MSFHFGSRGEVDESFINLRRIFAILPDNVDMMRRWIEARKVEAAGWLRQGMSPRRLALTLALGFAIGCIPVVGVPTLLCLTVALAFRLNVPAIQAANMLALPLQVALILPFVRLGGWLFSNQPPVSPLALLHGSPLHALSSSGAMAAEATGAWLVVATPSVAVMTMGLTLILRRVPVLAAE